MATHGSSQERCSKWGAEWKNLRGRGDNELLLVVGAETKETRGRKLHHALEIKFQNAY
jgi:hypothetical protein